jgi:glycosyltransferase involved in cell wall biosynthesis
MSKKIDNRVSIVTVCYNSAETIRDTVLSVQSQNYANVEHVFVDGGSTDETLSILKSLKRDTDILISEADQGIYDAMNKGLALATGCIVGILNSDDVFYDTKVLSRIMTSFGHNKESDACFGDLVYVKRDNTNSIVRRYSSKNFSPKNIRFGAMCPHPTFYIRREILVSLGNYKLGYRVAADFEYMARFFQAERKAHRIDFPLVKMRMGGVSTTGLRWIIHQNFEIVRACNENRIYTNIFLIALKIPAKLLSFFR